MGKLIEVDFSPKPEALNIFEEAIKSSKILVRFFTEDAQVPEQFREQKQLSLAFSRNFENCHDLEYDKDSVRATLTFSGESYYCIVPWDAVISMRTPVRLIYEAK